VDRDEDATSKFLNTYVLLTQAFLFCCYFSCHPACGLAVYNIAACQEACHLNTATMGTEFTRFKDGILQDEEFVELIRGYDEWHQGMIEAMKQSGM
jgi:hypothetical protein